MTVPADQAAPVEALPPPAGPGVVPPFAAPPTDRDNKRIWIGLGVSALVLVLCCVGGVVGAVVLAEATSQRAETMAKSTVTEYLEALRHDAYRTAFDLRCDALKRREDLQRFSTRMRQNPVTNFEVEGMVTDSSELEVSATVDYERLGRTHRVYTMAAVVGEDDLRICGER